MNYLESAQTFLQHKHLFQLGVLPTEQCHPKTKKLSEQSQSNVTEALEVLRSVDQDALDVLLEKEESLSRLSEAIYSVLESGHKVYLCGCGATGRLSLTLEWLFRNQDKYPDQVISLMAGGDVALVHSIEGFEDFPEYGARHLEQLGFTDGDLLVSSTEGGETPYVIGATEWASENSSVPPFYLYCNPDNVLIEYVERSKRILQNSKIQKINLCVGPMALAGSTRMQASTVLQLAIGFAFESALGRSKVLSQTIGALKNCWDKVDLKKLEGYVIRESDIYKSEEHVLYRLKGSAITVFTDTTERAPTFSLAPFSNKVTASVQPVSYCYVIIDSAPNKQAAWSGLLGRPPRPLNWSEINIKTSQEYLDQFDFGRGAAEWRASLSVKAHHDFVIEETHDGFTLILQDLQLTIDVEGLSLFERQLILKMVLNAHSTLVMGRLDRYKSNMMTWVSPSNGKLIDRSSRYLRALAEMEGVALEEDQSIRIIFEVMKSLKIGESVVLKSLQATR